MPYQKYNDLLQHEMFKTDARNMVNAISTCKDLLWLSYVTSVEKDGELTYFRET